MPLRKLAREGDIVACCNEADGEKMSVRRLWFGNRCENLSCLVMSGLRYMYGLLVRAVDYFNKQTLVFRYSVNESRGLSGCHLSSKSYRRAHAPSLIRLRASWRLAEILSVWQDRRLSRNSTTVGMVTVTLSYNGYSWLRWRLYFRGTIFTLNYC